jgi:hypothetical protein
VPAANYYGGNGSVQTLFYNLSAFVGTITIQATLNDIPEVRPNGLTSVNVVMAALLTLDIPVAQ